jgi:hypothetical protein
VHSINNRGPQAAIAALLALTMAGSALAAPLVVRSAGPSAKTYPAGKALADNAKLTLKAGDMVVLLDGKGTRTLSGPGTFSASASTVAASSATSTLVALASNNGERRARIGAVRSVSGTDPTGGRNPNVWFIDLNRSSNMCIADPSSLTVWRHDATAAAAVTVTRVADGTKGTVDLASGQTRAAWPASLAVTNGDKYTLSWAGAKTPTALKFVIVTPPASGGLEDMASSLIQGGCSAQLDLLIETVTPAAAPKG